MFYVLRETLSVILRKSGGVSLFVFGGEKKMTHQKRFLFILCLICCLCLAVPALATDHISISTNGAGGVVIGSAGSVVTSAADGYSLILGKYKSIGQGVVGICVLVSLISLILYITKLAAAGSNPSLRQKAINGIIFSGVALAMFGGLPFIVSACLALFK